MTAAGLILGTAAYMAPEQAKGKAVDKRADIWAFGCVLYEMLIGTCAFPGDVVTETLAAVLKTEPVWTRVPVAAQPLLKACLEKAPRRRPQRLREPLTCRRPDAGRDVADSEIGVADLRLLLDEPRASLAVVGDIRQSLVVAGDGRRSPPTAQHSHVPGVANNLPSARISAVHTHVSSENPEAGYRMRRSLRADKNRALLACSKVTCGPGCRVGSLIASAPAGPERR
jgi:serine/threonine protein kinase